jgi:transcription initiation factor TFIID TATA-box-binding protein
VVATSALNHRLDLGKLQGYKEVNYDPDFYGGRAAYFKCPKTGKKVSIFASGKIVSAGATSEREAIENLECAREFLVEKGFSDVVAFEKKIQNIVVIADFNRSINVEHFVEKCQAVYEPEQFPGAILRLQRPVKATALVFASGKVAVTGLKSSIQIEPVIRRIASLLETYG